MSKKSIRKFRPLFGIIFVILFTIATYPLYTLIIEAQHKLPLQLYEKKVVNARAELVEAIQECRSCASSLDDEMNKTYPVGAYHDENSSLRTLARNCSIAAIKGDANQIESCLLMMSDIVSPLSIHTYFHNKLNTLVKKAEGLYSRYKSRVDERNEYAQEHGFDLIEYSWEGD